jgi:hypothetical protein
MTRSLQGFLEELLGRDRVTPSGKPKVDGGAGGINSTIQEPPVPALADVGFVKPPGAVGRFQFPPESLVQFRGVAPSVSSLSDSRAPFLATHPPRSFPKKTRVEN